MGLATFFGGIHPYEGKELSMNKETTVLMPQGELVYPMSQHVGAPAKPIVQKGDTVLVGQIIGEATEFVSANVISSVSGTVKAIEQRLTASGQKVQSIVVENDYEYKTVENFGTPRDYKKLSKEEIRNIIKEAGIVGLGGAAFPTHVKLTPKNDADIKYVIVNAAECEPYLTSDYRMMLEEPESLMEGLKIILKLFENAKGIISIEDNKPEAIKTLQSLVEKESNISVKVLKTKYPQGSERQLVYATIGKKINSTMLPVDVGCIVNNVDTVISIYNAVAKTTSLIRRVLTVTGDAINEPRNFTVLTGTNYQELIAAAGGFKVQPEKVISGGPMMGTALFSLDVPVTKASSALLCLAEDPVKVETTACIRCGKCIEVCPCGLAPNKLALASDRHDEEAFIKLNGMECYECGSCTYICPAKRVLTQSFKETRRTILEKRKRKQ